MYIIIFIIAQPQFITSLRDEKIIIDAKKNF